MGRRDIIITGLFTALALSGGALATALSSTPNSYTNYLVSIGWTALILAILGLAYMFRTAPKAAAGAAQSLLEGPPPRDFLDEDLTPSVFRAKVLNKTSVQVDALSKTYAGKWMKVQGAVYDITDTGSSKHPQWTVFLKDEEGLVGVTFSGSWLEQLVGLTKGEWVVAIGKITRLHHGPSLADGELVHVGKQPDKTAAKPKQPRRRSPGTLAKKSQAS